MKNIISFIVIFCIAISSVGQGINTDSLHQKSNIKFHYKALIIPSVLIAYGSIGTVNDDLQSLNISIRDKLNGEPHTHIRIDDYSEYANFVAVYGLNALGVKGKNNLLDRTIIMGTACLIIGTTAPALKKLTSIQRPDKSGSTSFPSGHTTTAFTSAEFLYQEFRDVSIWYGVSGYVVAIGTGFLRMYNNRHWLTDVVAGAGIGILSTKIAYWLFPVIKSKLFNTNDKNAGVIVPFYNRDQYGVITSILF